MESFDKTITPAHSSQDILAAASAYWDAHSAAFERNLARLIAIESVEDIPHAAPCAPFGPGVADALTAMLDIARDLGLSAVNEEGYVGLIDLPGRTDKQIGIIGHVDVVPAGDGWDSNPFTLTQREGYLVGRGVTDDKGPALIALYAMKFWADACAGGAALPYSLRFIVGTNEETAMRDVAYYRTHHADPAFLFTPDAEFPVGYGEKGIYQATVVSEHLKNGLITSLEGGLVFNAVPAHARAAFADDAYPPAERAGVAAHASRPEGGINAINLLVSDILREGHCSAQEREFLALVETLTGDTTGARVGIACEDEDFGKLTFVGGKVYCKDGHICQTIDCRYPTAITADDITKRLTALAAEAHATLVIEKNEDPFLMKKDSPAVAALLAAYREATGETEAKPFTMGGGTYARKFSNAASFGPEFRDSALPAWSAGMHGKNEAIAKNDMRRAFMVYVLTIARLMEAQL